MPLSIDINGDAGESYDCRPLQAFNGNARLTCVQPFNFVTHYK